MWHASLQCLIRILKLLQMCASITWLCQMQSQQCHRNGDLQGLHSACNMCINIFWQPETNVLHRLVILVLIFYVSSMIPNIICALAHIFHILSLQHELIVMDVKLSERKFREKQRTISRHNRGQKRSQVLPCGVVSNITGHFFSRDHDRLCFQRTALVSLLVSSRNVTSIEKDTPTHRIPAFHTKCIKTKNIGSGEKKSLRVKRIFHFVLSMHGI